MTPLRRVLVLVILLITLLATTLAVILTRPSEEELVRRSVERAIRAAEERDADKLLKQISQNYRGSAGAGNYTEFARYTRRALAVIEALSILPERWDIVVHPPQASVTLEFNFRMRTRFGPEVVTRSGVREPGEPERAGFLLVKEEDGWKIVEMDAPAPR